MPAGRLTTRSHRLESRNLHPGLPLAYSTRRVPSAPPANSANRPADPEDAPGCEGDAGQRKARDVQHRFVPDLIVGDANVAFCRGPAACATATTAAFLRPRAAFRLLATATARTVPIAEGKPHLCHGDDGHTALPDRLAEHSSHSQSIYHLLDRLEVRPRLIVHSTTFPKESSLGPMLDAHRRTLTTT